MDLNYIFHTEPFTLNDINYSPAEPFICITDADSQALKYAVRSDISTLTGAIVKDDALSSFEMATGLHMHLPSNPDIDTCIAAFLLKHFIETGRLPKAAANLADYAEKLCAGAITIDPSSPNTFTFILLFIKEYAIKYSAADQSLKLLEKSEILIKQALINFLLDPYYNLATDPIAKDEPNFTADIKKAEEDYLLYKKDRYGDKNTLPICKVYDTALPVADTNTVSLAKVKFMAWLSHPTCKMPDFWAFLEGCSLVLHPDGAQSRKQNTGPDNIKLVLNNSIDLSQSLTLEPLVYMLELAEQVLEAEADSSAKRWRTNPADHGQNPAPPFGITTDPWTYTQAINIQTINSPSAGTKLAISDIINLISATQANYVTRCSLRACIPLTFMPNDYYRVLSRLRQNGWEASDMPYANLTHDMPASYLAYKASNQNFETFSYAVQSLNLMLYKTGVAIIYMDINPDVSNLYSYCAIKRLIELKQQVLATDIQAVLSSLHMPRLPFIKVNPLQTYITLSTASFAYPQGSLLQAAASLAYGEWAATLPDKSSYVFINPGLVAVFDDDACAVINAESASNSQENQEHGLDNALFFEYAAIIYRKTLLSELALKLHKVSPIHVNKLNNIGKLLLLTENSAQTNAHNPSAEVGAFFGKGLEYHNIMSITNELTERYSKVHQFIKFKFYRLALILCCIAIPLVILFFLFKLSFIDLKPILYIDSMNRLEFNEDKTNLLAWAGVALFLIITAFGILKLIDHKSKK